jgi:hypothetical protein
MKETSQNFVKAVLSNNKDEAKNIFDQMMSQKYQDAIDAKKIAVAQKIYK